MFRGLSFFISGRPRLDALRKRILRQDVAIGLLLAVLTFAAYWNVTRNGFVNFDDPGYITYNPIVFHGLTWPGIKWAFVTGAESNWHPLTWLSLMLDCQLFGERVGLHHLENVFWHAANTLLLFGFLKRATGAVWRSAMVAALFAVHPLHVESVAWASERKDTLSTFFGLLAIHAYLSYAKRPAISRYSVIVLCFILSLMAKPMLVTLPFLLLLLDVWPLGRWPISPAGKLREFQSRSFVRLLLEKCPLIALSVTSSVITFLVQRAGGAIMSEQRAPFTTRVANAGIAYVAYLQKMVWPHPLAVYYPYPNTIPTAEAVICGIVMVLITCAVFWFARRRIYYLAVGWLWYVGTLVPVIGLVQVGTQSMADRYTYIPLIGIFIMIVWGVSDLLPRWKYRVPGLGTCGAVIIVGCIMGTRIQVDYWRNSIGLFQHALEVCPDSAVSHHNLGHALFSQGNYQESIAEYEKALAIWPDYGQAHYNLANSLNFTGDLKDAVSHYERALGLNPGYVQAHYGLGATLATQGDYAKAREHFLEALRLKPDYSEAHAKFGNLLVIEGDLDEAVAHYRVAIRYVPENFEAHLCLAGTLGRQRKFVEAAAQYRAAINLRTNDVSALNDLAWILAAEDAPEIHDAGEAVRLAQRACELTHFEGASYLDTLAVAYSEAGNFSGAIEMTRKAVAAARKAGREQLANTIESRLKFYEQHVPYHRILVSASVTEKPKP